jgi:hypothetical protein
MQHERITALAQELRLQALPDLYGAVAQSAAKRKDASYGASGSDTVNDADCRYDEPRRPSTT